MQSVFLHVSCWFSTWSGNVRKFSPCWFFQKAPFTSVLVYFLSSAGIWCFMYWFGQWHRGFSPAKNQVLSRFSLIYFLLMFCSQEERGRGGWWHERAGSLGRNHVTTAVTACKRLWLPILGANVLCWGESISKMSLSLILTQSSGNCIAVFCVAWSAQRKERGAEGIACGLYGWIAVKRSLQNQNIQLLDCATATAGSSSAKFGPYWIEVSWKKEHSVILSQFKCV